MRNYILVCQCEDLIPIGYTGSNFQSDLDFRKSTSGCSFTLGGGAISWRSVKHIELDRCEIYYSPNNCQMNNKSHDFYLHELLILIE